MGVVMVGLAIDFLLDFFDLVAEVKIEFEFLFDFFDAVHDGGVIFDADLDGDFGGAEFELFGEEIHGDLTGGLDVGDAGFAGEFFEGEVVIFGDLLDDLLG